MKLKRGEQIVIRNWIFKSSEILNSGFVATNFKKRKTEQSPTIEHPGGWLVTAPASVAVDNEICDRCYRIYLFDQAEARGQCKCKGKEVG